MNIPTVQLNSIALAPGVPAVIELIPPGPTITGRDGRSWTMKDPSAIVANFNANCADIPVDLEHASELKAPKGEPAPAIGWIKSLLVNAQGGISANVEWAASGTAALASKAYRYLSPAFTVDRATSAIIRLTSVGLTNQPNLLLPALNRACTTPPKKETHSMNEFLTKCLAALGLEPTATEEAALAAIGKLTADAADGTDAADMTEQATAALNRAQTAETELNSIKAELAGIKAEAHGKDVMTAVNSALVEGKILPAQKEWATGYATADLNGFNSFVATAVKVAPTGDQISDKVVVRNSVNADVAAGVAIANAFNTK